MFKQTMQGLATKARRFNDTAFRLRETKFVLDMTLWQQGHMLRNQMLAESRNRDPLRLLRHGYRSFSQNDEDGIIEEIFNRIGTATKQFIEIGVENGQENNTHNLLYKNWGGTWIEGSNAHIASINRDFNDRIASGQLQVLKRFVTIEFVGEMMKCWHDLDDIDLFSIDIDGNDYHIVSAMPKLRARAVIVEYNGRFRPPIDWVMPYRSDYVWQGENLTGCSLAAWVRLFREKGYSLVGCGMPGVNAFFVRDDLLGNKFSAPFTAENHFEPRRIWLCTFW